MYLTQYWDDPSVPDELLALLRSYRELNPGLEYQCMHRKSAERFIGERFTTREVAAFRACAVPAMQADYFRYCAVLALGGFYADADTRCIAPLAPLLPADAEAVVFARDNSIVINGCFAFREPGHPLLATVLEIATLGIERRLANDVWLTTGPGIFTFLHLLSEMTRQERIDLDYDNVVWNCPKSLRLIHDIARERHGDLDHLFDRIHVARFDELAMCCQEEWVDYKSTPRHWANWPGNIFQ